MEGGCGEEEGMRELLLRLFEILLGTYGPQGWWPVYGKGERKLEIAIGAILTQNTSWENAEKAIMRMADAGLMEIRALCEVGEGEMVELIRPAGFPSSKARTIRELARLIIDRFDGEIDRLFELPTEVSRNFLLEIKGIGPETADAILLYAGDKPVFVVDSYTTIVMRCNRLSFPLPPRLSAKRRGLSRGEYARWQEFFHENLPADPDLFKEFHALIVEHGKRGHCRSGRKEGCRVCGEWEGWRNKTARESR
jgi:endonuclease-3 related protein